MNPMYVGLASQVCFANDNDALIPELWARESVRILEESMTMANLVHRDFSNEIKNFGDLVHTRKPSQAVGRRRTDADEYVEADVSVTDIRVPLDQWFYDSFIIKDGEASMAMSDLIAVHLVPRVQGIARQVDRMLLGQVHKFFKGPTQRAGKLGGLSSSTTRDYLLEVNELFNTQKAYDDDRNLMLTPYSETALLKTDLFTKVNESGESAALRKATIGSLYNLALRRAVNANWASSANADTVAGTVTNALAAGVGGSQVVVVTSYEVNAGEFVVAATNGQPTWASARTASTNTTAVTLNEVNKYATGASDVLTVYKKADAAASYAAGHAKYVRVDGHTADKNPRVGQLIAFGTTTRHVYTIIEAVNVSTTSTDMLLDRPLDVAVADNDLAFPGPAGSINFAFHKNAIAMVSRPVAAPQDPYVRTAVADHNGVGMRIVMQYDSKKGGTRVNLDLLAGTGVLDLDLGVVLLG